MLPQDFQLLVGTNADTHLKHQGVKNIHGYLMDLKGLAEQMPDQAAD